MARRIPKDIQNYLKPSLSFGQLMMTAMRNVLLLKNGVSVKWELKLSYYVDPSVPDDSKCVAYVAGATFRSSGEEESQDTHEEGDSSS